MAKHTRSSLMPKPLVNEMSTASKAAEMRHAIDMIEGAIMGCGNLLDLPNIYAGASDDLIITPKLLLSEVRRVREALKECTRIINSPEYDAFARRAETRS